ncbi:MAG: NUDIX domain-containing protein [Defluviitaleaceae bacterium]|nr:NUDIX domain-containing protein [Defluviitaleaceae bacterium]
MFENSYKIRVSSRAIIIDNDKILLNCFGDGLYYNFPGGGIEKNETAKQAVVREVLEESGLAVDAGALVFSLEYEPFNCNYCYGKGHHISFFFRCFLNPSITPVKAAIADVNPDNEDVTSTAKWVPLSELHTINLVPKISEPLMEYVETGIFEPSFWDKPL